MENIVLYGGSFNPPHKAHKIIAETLAKQFDKVFIIPCGIWKKSTENISNEHRMKMSEIAFKNISNTVVDLCDLINNIYTPTFILKREFQTIFPNSKIWIAIGEDAIVNGRNKQSEIHRIWDFGNEIWNNLNWIILTRPGYGAIKEDLPPNNIVIEIKDIYGSGTLIRKLINTNKSISHLVDTEIEKYIFDHNLYLKGN